MASEDKYGCKGNPGMPDPGPHDRCEMVEAVLEARVAELELQIEANQAEFDRQAAAMDAIAAERLTQTATIERLRAALAEIALGYGPFSRDQLVHATNTIEAMKGLARAALAAGPGPGDES